MIKDDVLTFEDGGASTRDTVFVTGHLRSLQLTHESITTLTSGIAYRGSVVVCRVVSIGFHDKVENRRGRLVRLNEGDLIMGVMGDRYSTTSMYGGVPQAGIAVQDHPLVDLLSSGGLIGLCKQAPDVSGATKLQIVGLAFQAGELLTIHPVISAQKLAISCPLLLVAGTSANVGKTKFASKLTHFLSHHLKKQVAVTKLAGAGNMDDTVALSDAGAVDAFDFVEAGLVSTYGVPGDTILAVAKGVLNRLGEKKPDVIIAELGGDITGAGIPDLLADTEISSNTVALILVPSDIMAAKGSMDFLQEKGFTREVQVGQPLKNAVASQERAWKVIDKHLYDCESIDELSTLVSEILGWQRRKREPESEYSFSTEQEDEVGIGSPS